MGLKLSLQYRRKKDFFNYTLGTITKRLGGKHPQELRLNVIVFFWPTNLINILLDGTLYTKFGENPLKITISIRIYVLTIIIIILYTMYSIYNTGFFKKTLQACSGGQYRSSFHSPGLGSHHDSHLNYSISLWKFANKSCIWTKVPEKHNANKGHKEWIAKTTFVLKLLLFCDQWLLFRIAFALHSKNTRIQEWVLCDIIIILGRFILNWLKRSEMLSSFHRKYELYESKQEHKILFFRLR